MPSTSVTGGGLGLQHRVAEGADLRRRHAARLPSAMSDPGTTSTSSPAVAVRRRRPSTLALPDVAFTLRDRPRACSATAASTPAPRCSCARRPRRRPTGDLLDLGCGDGPIALTLALRSPGGAGVGGRRQRAGAGAVPRERRRQRASTTSTSPRPTTCPTTCASTTIWSNPPIRIGKPALTSCCCAGSAASRPDGTRRPRRAEAPRRRLAAALAGRAGPSRGADRQPGRLPAAQVPGTGGDSHLAPPGRAGVSTQASVDRTVSAGGRRLLAGGCLVCVRPR